MTKMKSIDLVCLCELYDLKVLFGPGFDENYPWINVIRPDDVQDPESIRYAMVFSPGPTAFSWRRLLPK